MKLKLNKNNIKFIAIFIIVLLIYNVVIFAVPFKHTGTFIGAYIFGLVSILAQIGVILLAGDDADTLQKKVYAFPIVRMGLIYLVVQVAVSMVFAAVASFVENFPNWIIYVVSVILLGVFTILVLLMDTTRDKVIEIEKTEERQTIQVKTFRINIDSILRRVEDKDLYAKLEKLSDIARYSDPVSNDDLHEIEAEITDKIGEIDSAIKIGDLSYAKVLVEETIDLFEDRNAQCKMLKRK